MSFVSLRALLHFMEACEYTRRRRLCGEMLTPKSLVMCSEPFFDFCIGIDGQPLQPPAPSKDAGLGAWKSLEEREGQSVTLNVWNAKHHAVRGTYWIAL